MVVAPTRKGDKRKYVVARRKEHHDRTAVRLHVCDICEECFRTHGYLQLHLQKKKDHAHLIAQGKWDDESNNETSEDNDGPDGQGDDLFQAASGGTRSPRPQARALNTASEGGEGGNGDDHAFGGDNQEDDSDADEQAGVTDFECTETRTLFNVLSEELRRQQREVRLKKRVKNVKKR